MHEKGITGRGVGIAILDQVLLVDHQEYADRLKLYEEINYLAQAIRRILQINQALPVERKIRVISIQISWHPEQGGYADVSAAAQEARAAGLLVVSSSIEQVHGFKFHGLGRAPMADPDQLASYTPGLFWSQDFYAGKGAADRLLVPMDARTVAGTSGPGDYAFYPIGGRRLSRPWRKKPMQAMCPEGAGNRKGQW